MRRLLEEDLRLVRDSGQTYSRVPLLLEEAGHAQRRGALDGLFVVIDLFGSAINT